MSPVQEWEVEDVAPAWHINNPREDPSDCSIQAVKSANGSAVQSCTTEAMNAAAEELMSLLMS